MQRRCRPDTSIPSSPSATSRRRRQQEFLKEYHSAHPGQPEHRNAPQRHTRTLHLQVPVMEDERKQKALDSLIRDTVRRLCDLVA